MNYSNNSILYNSRKRALIIAACVLLYTSLTFFTDTQSIALRGHDVQYKKIAIFHSLWLLWIPLSFAVIWLASKFPIRQGNTWVRIRLHLLFSVLFAFFHALIFIALINILGYIFYDSNFDFKIYIHSTWVANFHTQIIIYLFILTADQAVDYVAKYKDEITKNVSLTSKIATAQNQLLKMQMQPHFLFNTHHSIISLMSLNKTKEAAEMLTKLSDLLRKTLDMPNKEFVTLKEELELVKLYLDIQLIRFGDRLSIKYNIPDETLNKKLPVFIIQPLVENAIRHGIEPVSDSGAIKISSFLKHQKLLINIEDDGAGYNKRNESNGIGLANIRERLKNHFGDNYSLQIEKREPRGTVIEIELPLLNQKN